MLEKHLLIKTEPVALNENVVYFKDFRITVLFDRLFRIEKNVNGDFSDLATQSVWFRNMPKVSYSINKTESFIEIKTARVTLHLECAIEDSYVIIGEEKVPINNDGNLLGTTRTLDQYNGDVHIKEFTRLKLGTGVCSKTGVAVSFKAIHKAEILLVCIYVISRPPVTEGISRKHRGASCYSV